MDEPIEIIIDDDRWSTIAVIAVTAAATVGVVKVVQSVRSYRWLKKHYPRARKI